MRERVRTGGVPCAPEGRPRTLDDVPAVHGSTARPEAHRLPERGRGRVRGRHLEVDPLDAHRLRLFEEARRERAPDSLPTHCGIDEEVIEDEEPAFLRGRGIDREGHADDRALLPRDEDDAADAVAHDLLDGPRDPFGPRLHAFGGEVGRDEAFHVEAVRRIRALDEDHRPRATSRRPIKDCCGAVDQKSVTRTVSPFSNKSTFAGISMYPSAWAIDVIAPLSLYAGTACPSTIRTV